MQIGHLSSDEGLANFDEILFALFVGVGFPNILVHMGRGGGRGDWAG
jgi:hypothetical protein